MCSFGQTACGYIYRGPRTRDDALIAVGEPVLRAVPGYTISTEMGEGGTGPRLFVTPPAGATVVHASSSDTGMLTVGTPAPSTANASITVVDITGLKRGRARVVRQPSLCSCVCSREFLLIFARLLEQSVGFSDGTASVAHYYVLPPFKQQIEAVSTHWSEVAWLPRDFPDPFGIYSTEWTRSPPPPPTPPQSTPVLLGLF
jgi:hypothetical protein